jgi:hypothetical protein
MNNQNAIVRSFSKIDPEVLVTAEMLSGKFSPLIDVVGLASIFRTKPSTITQNISKEVFPVSVTKIGGKWYATAYAVAEYIVENKQNKNSVA